MYINNQAFMLTCLCDSKGRLGSVMIAVFLPGLKGGKVLIWEKGTFARPIILRALLCAAYHFECTFTRDFTF